MAKIDKSTYYKKIPKVDVLLEDKNIKKAIDYYGHNFIVDVIRWKCDEIRCFIDSCNDADQIKKTINGLTKNVVELCEAWHGANLKKVINGTGVVLHTNLGRAPLGKAQTKNMDEVAAGYTNLEYDLSTGKRNRRYAHVEDKLKYLTGAEAGVVVNNNAAAVMLVLNTIAKNKEVITSRGELVEIGGSFRIPDVMNVSRAKLVEVGTTNKTHLADYENAITSKTAALLKVHTSNYKIVGFSESPSINELRQIADEHSLIVYEDLGSGTLIDFSEFGLCDEPTVQNSINLGVDIVSFSGDKLLGGPQAGIIVGKKRFIEKIKKNPLNRTLRVDKFTLALLDSTLTQYLNKDEAIKNIPVLNMLTSRADDIKIKAETLQKKLAKQKLDCTIAIEKTKSQAGGGSMPLLEIDSYSIAFSPTKISVNSLENKLRKSEIPIIGRCKNDKYYLDLRTIDKTDFEIIASEVYSALKD